MLKSSIGDELQEHWQQATEGRVKIGWVSAWWLRLINVNLLGIGISYICEYLWVCTCEKVLYEVVDSRFHESCGFYLGIIFL